MAWEYSDKLLDHFRNPRNALLEKEPDFTFDGVGEVGNEKCGDIMKMWIAVEDDRIKECKWKTYGCTSAVGSTSVLSEMVKGKSVDEALSISPKDIQEELGGLPSAKIHCSVLGDKALQAAVYDYFRKSDQVHRIPEGDDIICQCLRVGMGEIRQCVADDLTSFHEIQERTKAATACGACRESIERAIKKALAIGGGID